MKKGFQFLISIFLFLVFEGCSSIPQQNLPERYQELSKNFALSDSFIKGFGVGQGEYFVKVELEHNELVFTGDISGRLKLPSTFDDKLDSSSNIKALCFWGARWSVSKSNENINSYSLRLIFASNRISSVEKIPNSQPTGQTSDPHEAWLFAGMDFIDMLKPLLLSGLSSKLKIEEPERISELKNFIDKSFYYRFTSCIKEGVAEKIKR